jgi:hypothetical protein
MTSIRIATEDDLDAMSTVATRNGIPLKVDEWRDFWNANPYAQQFQSIPLGLLLEAGGEIVGTCLNLPMMYELDGFPVRAVLGAGAAIDPAYRSKSLMLLGKGLRQKEADVCIVGSANAAVSQLLTVIARRIPSPDSDVPLLWPTDYRAFASAVLKRRNVPAESLLAMPAGIVLRIADLFRRKRGSTRIDVELSQHFDDRFDAFWERLRKGPRRLRAIRNRANLEWRFRREMRKGNVQVVMARSGRELQGYVVLVRANRDEFGFAVHEVADLQAVGDDPNVIQPLLLQALTVAKGDRSGMLKLRGWNAGKRTAAVELGPHSYRYPLWQAYYSNANAALSSSLATADVWDFSPFEIF